MVKWDQSYSRNWGDRAEMRYDMKEITYLYTFSKCEMVFQSKKSDDKN